MTARDEARAASHHADTADGEYRKLYDVAEKLAKALERFEWSWEARDALEAWKLYRPVWEVTG